MVDFQAPNCQAAAGKGTRQCSDVILRKRSRSFASGSRRRTYDSVHFVIHRLSFRIRFSGEESAFSLQPSLRGVTHVSPFLRREIHALRSKQIRISVRLQAYRHGRTPAGPRPSGANRHRCHPEEAEWLACERLPAKIYRFGVAQRFQRCGNRFKSPNSCQAPSSASFPATPRI